jgi:hypothetical protein
MNISSVSKPFGDMTVLEHFPDDLLVTGEVRVHDENVVEVYHDIARQDEILEDVVHHCLEGRGGVCQAEVHHQRLEESLVSLECGLPLITLLDPDVVKAHQMLSFVKNWAPFKQLIRSLIRGIGSPFFMVIVLSAQ